MTSMEEGIKTMMGTKTWDGYYYNLCYYSGRKVANGKCYEHVIDRVTGEDQAFEGFGTNGYPFSAISIASNALNPCLRAVEM